MKDETAKPGLWQRCKGAVSNHHSKTLIAMAMRSTTAEEWKEGFDKEFDRAKRASDFIGMLMRTGFVFLAFLYFSDAAEEAGNPFSWWINSACKMFALVLYGYMYFRLNRLMAIYLLSDTAYWKSRTAKSAIIIVSFVLSGISVFGVSKVAYVIANASSLIR